MDKYNWTFNGVDMMAAYGVRAVQYDQFLPSLRERRVVVPGRSGSYDYGAFAYDDRTLRIQCATLGDIGMPRSQMREIQYALSQKGRLTFWDEPDKYYIGRVYDAAELENLGDLIYKFDLSFLCEPFAYGRTVTQGLSSGENPLRYQGTARTPSLIVLRNTGTEAIQNLQLTAIYKR